MPETIYIGNDINTAKTKVLFDERDFVELVGERLGTDARRYIEQLIEQRDAIHEQYKEALADVNYWKDICDQLESETSATECGLTEVNERLDILKSVSDQQLNSFEEWIVQLRNIIREA